MRRDTRILLRKLRQDNFPYRDFNYTFCVNSDWKILTELHNDIRILGTAPVKSPVVADDVSPAAVPVLPDAVSVGARPGRYGHPVAAPERRVDLNQFFTRFTEGE